MCGLQKSSFAVMPERQTQNHIQKQSKLNYLSNWWGWDASFCSSCHWEVFGERPSTCHASRAEAEHLLKGSTRVYCCVFAFTSLTTLAATRRIICVHVDQGMWICRCAICRQVENICCSFDKCSWIFYPLCLCDSGGLLCFSSLQVAEVVMHGTGLIMTERLLLCARSASC